jgi:hypothetical protein
MRVRHQLGYLLFLLVQAMFDLGLEYSGVPGQKGLGRELLKHS